MLETVRRHTLCLILLLAGCSWNARSINAPAVLRIAVTTSTRDSGLLDALLPMFERSRKVRVDVIAVGTGAALKLGAAGDVDVVLVHAREAEDAFMAAQHGLRREDVMYNWFDLLGPQDDPAKASDVRPAAALQRIAESGQMFISRGDQSGTHIRELQLWEAAGGKPDWVGYLESGQGMGQTLTMADELHAYVLTDRGTYLKFKDKISLAPTVASSEGLRNPYGVITVNPRAHSGVNVTLANQFVDFLISAETQRMIRDYHVAGQPLFFPMHLDGQD